MVGLLVLCFGKSTHVGDGQARAGLPPGDAAEAGLVLHDAVGNAHLAAEGGQEENELWIEMNN